MKRATLILWAVVCLVMGNTASAQQLSIHCLDIGYGDCTVIISPTGETMLIDAGPSYNASEDHLYEYLNGLVSQVDYLIVTHYHYDHLGGVEALVDSGWTIGTVFDRGWSYCKTDYTDKYIPAIDTIRNTIGDGETIDLGGGVTATVLSVNGNGLLGEPFVDTECTTLVTADENDYCAALLIEFGEFDFFVAGDLPGYNDGGYTDIETSIAPETGPVEVYRVNQHGSKYSTNQMFLETLSPAVSILSVGNNGHGHPDTAVVRRVKEVSVVYQTSDSDGVTVDGDIVIQTDGNSSFDVNGDVYPIHAAPYYHAFQNFDDDVDRVKRYSNCFGGNYSIIPEVSGSPLIECSYDTMNTRGNFGRCLRIDYDPLIGWTMYLESFVSEWDNFAACLNLTDLFPDYEGPEFSARHIDSLVFYCKLVAANALTLKLELKDSLDVGSSSYVDVEPDGTWQRFAVALDEFTGSFDPTAAKFLGLTFEAGSNNIGEEGTLYVDDIYLVENGFQKPSFADDAELLDYLNKVNFRYFWTFVEPVSKFAMDRSTSSKSISVDAIGFQLASYAIAHQNGWIDPSLVEERVTHILTYLLYQCEHATDPSDVADEPLIYATMNGIWAHFLDYQTLARKDPWTEFSLFTNALLLPGVLVCGEYFAANDSIASMADSLYRMADWNFLYVPDSNIMHYCWTADEGRSSNWSDWFTEELDLAFLLAYSSPVAEHRINANPFESPYYYRPECLDFGPWSYVYSAPGANFTYYFLQMYVRFLPGDGGSVGRFENARNALQADIAYCSSEYCPSYGYDERIFGTTACEGPDSAGIDINGDDISNYHAYGYPCRFDVANEPNGTVAVYGSGAATLFIPNEATACLRYYYDELDSIFADNYGYNFWSPIFGFPDAFHLAPDICDDASVNTLCFRGPWVSVPRFGIDVGPMLLNIDSYLSEESGNASIRDWFSQNPYIAANLAEFDPIETRVEHQYTDLPSGYRLYFSYPNPFNASTQIQFDMPRRGRVYLEVVNILGQQVSVLVDRVLASGSHHVEWSGKDKSGQPVATGLYFCRMKAGDFVGTKKMLLLK